MAAPRPVLRAVETPPPAVAATPKRVRAKIAFQRERFADIWMELAALFPLHDREIWPNRTWGPLAPDIRAYLSMEETGRLLVTTARAGDRKRLVGYSMDVVIKGSTHYGRTSHALNDTIWLHPLYRVGRGLSIGKHPGFRLLLARERHLDELKIERRRMDAKLFTVLRDDQGRPKRLDFGALLKRLGYTPEAITYQRIVPQDED